MGRLPLPPVVAFFCCGASCGPRSRSMTVACQWGVSPHGEALLGLPLSVLLVVKEEQGLPRVACRQLSHHFGVPPVRPRINILAFVEHLPSTLSLGKDKLQQLQQQLQHFGVCKRASEQQLQSLAGSLNWACQAIQGGR